MRITKWIVGEQVIPWPVPAFGQQGTLWLGWYYDWPGVRRASVLWFEVSL